MELKSVFLGEIGLTTTSAQHVKDIAGHYVDDLKQKLNSITFVNTNISIIGSDNPTLINRGWTLEELNSLNKILFKIAKAQSLQAWLGEAISAKTALQDSVKSYSISDYCQENEIEYPKLPKDPQHVTEQQWLDTLSIKDRNRYLTLQTFCAVVGNFIHPSPLSRLSKPSTTNFHSARENALNYDKNPFSVTERGSDTIIYSYKPSISVDDINNKYFELQTIHRQYQAEFNALKHQFEVYRDSKYEKAMRDHAIEYNEKAARIEEIRAEWDKEFERLSQGASKLKIIIPDALKSIFDEINNLGK